MSMFDACTLRDITLTTIIVAIVLPAGLLLWSAILSLAWECYRAVKEERSKRQ